MANVNLTEVGKVGLTGWRATLGDRVATPLAQRTRLSEEQVKALIGALFLALTMWQFLKTLRAILEASRRERQLERL